MGVSGTHTTDLVFGAGPRTSSRFQSQPRRRGGGATAEVLGPVALDGTLEVDARENGIFRIGECSMNVAGKMRRTAAGQPISKGCAGTISTCKLLGNATLSSATGKWTDGLVQIDGTVTVDWGRWGHNVSLKMTGKISSLSSWKLDLSTAEGFVWKPAEFLKISKLSGSLGRADGRTTFSIGGEVDPWKYNDNLVFGADEGSDHERMRSRGGLRQRPGPGAVGRPPAMSIHATRCPLTRTSPSPRPGRCRDPVGRDLVRRFAEPRADCAREVRGKNPKLGFADAGPASDGSGAHTLAVTLTATASLWGKEINVTGAFSAKGYRRNQARWATGRRPRNSRNYSGSRTPSSSTRATTRTASSARLAGSTRST